MKWNFVYPGITALFLICNTPVFSKSTENKFIQPILNTPAHWFIAVGAGEQYPTWKNPIKVDNGSGFPAPYNQDLYATKERSAAVIALSLGRRWQTENFWLPSYSFGVFWQYLFRTNLGSSITQYSMPEFTNYKYTWELTSNLLLATAKINLVQYWKLSPYVNAGIGSSFNRTSDYKEQALPGVTARVSPRFAKFSTSEFSYNVGAGVDLQLTPQVIFSVGYNYQDLGKISSGSGKETWSNQSLNPGTYHSNEVLVSLSYLFGK
ncbi:MAG: outer membrane beta-barrel protein [Legionella sp.]|nr:outer membrane beta-barrel protein [Legionella sp.]